MPREPRGSDVERYLVFHPRQASKASSGDAGSSQLRNVLFGDADTKGSCMKLSATAWTSTWRYRQSDAPRGIPQNGRLRPGNLELAGPASASDCKWIKGRGARFKVRGQPSPSSRAVSATRPAEQCRTAGNSFSHEPFRMKGFRVEGSAGVLPV